MWRLRILAERALVHIAKSFARHEYLSLARHVEAGDEVQQRGLATSGRAHDGNELALFHGHVDATQSPHRRSLGFVGLSQAPGLHNCHWSSGS